MKIWLVSIFEQTPQDNNFSTRYLSIAEKALKKGHKVTFFASTFRHNTKNQRFEKTTKVELESNYDAIYIKSIPYQSNFGLKRFYSHYKFAHDFLKYIKREEKPDIILFAFPPIFLASKISNWARKNNVKIVADIIDPWPDNFTKFAPAFFRFLLNPLFVIHRGIISRVFKRIDGLTAISNQYVDWVMNYRKSFVPSKCFYPAVDLNLILQNKPKSTKERFGNQRPFTIIYAGSLAMSYDIKCILNAAKLLNESHKDKIKFIIAGAGPQDGLINIAVKSISNLEFLGRVSKNELISLYSNSDLGLTQHVKGSSQSVTYKLFDLLGNGLPILNSLESEMKEIILNNKVGLFNIPGNHKQLIENILYFYNNPDDLEKYSENGIALTQKYGDSEMVYNHFVNYLEDIYQSE